MNIDSINSELQLAGQRDTPVTTLPAGGVHPFQRTGLGLAPFTCVGIDIDDEMETRCCYCTTRIKFVFNIEDANGRSFHVGSECVKQTGGAVAGFEKFNRMMAGRIAELRKKAAADKMAAAADAWRAQFSGEYAYMQRRAASGNGFYRYLVECVAKYGSIFDSKLAAVQKDMKRDEAWANNAPPQPRPEVNLQPVQEAFDRAKAAGIKWPKLRLGEFVFSPAGDNSANRGAIYIKQGSAAGEEGSRYLGKVMSGKLFASRDCTEDEKTSIVELAQDPLAAAVAYGKKFGRCSVCNRTLSDPESVEAGIGPICAGRYGWR